MKSGQWMFNFGNEENWCEDEYYDTREEAVKAGDLEAIERNEYAYQVGQIACFEPSIDADSVIDDISSNAYDECGEHGEDYLCRLPKKEVDRLQELLDEVLVKWIKETNNEPTFYKIENSETIQSSVDWLEGI